MVRAIHDNDRDPSSGVRGVFTPSEAMKMLPLVRMIADDLVRLSRVIGTQREQLRGIEGIAEPIDQPHYRDELVDIRSSLAEDERRLQECLDELSALGVQPHEPIDGSVDFPAIVNRRPVRLCWHPDDHSVEYWHEIGQSKSDRKKLADVAGKRGDGFAI